MGSYSNMVKMQILEGYANFKGLLAFLGLKWNGKPFVIGFVSFFGPDLAQRSIVFLTF